jgi:hypothetical protein
MRTLPSRRNRKCFTTFVTVDVGPIHPGTLKRAVEHPPSRSDEWFTRDVLLIAGLLPNQHHRGAGVSRPEHRLRRVGVELTGSALRCVPTQLGKFRHAWRLPIHCAGYASSSYRSMSWP